MKSILTFMLLLCVVSVFAQPRKQQTLLVIFAHPDDEGAIAPVIAKYAETHKVYIVIGTDGRYGTRDFAGIPEGDSLAAVRKKEMECSCSKLGVQPPIMLGFHDGMGMRTGVGESFKQLYQLTKKLRDTIAFINPDFIITFGPDGDTGHPDHRMIGNITTQIILQEGWDKKYPLYYVAWTKQQSDMMYPANLNYMDSKYLNVEINFEDRHEAMGWEAIKCHKSQFNEKEYLEWVNADKKAPNILYFRKFVVERGKMTDF